MFNLLKYWNLISNDFIIFFLGKKSNIPLIVSTLGYLISTWIYPVLSESKNVCSVFVCCLSDGMSFENIPNSNCYLIDPIP